MREYTDEEIVQQVRGGDINAFGILVSRYEQKAFSLALSILKDRTLAEDAAQEAFVKAYKGLKKYRGGSAFGTWFYRIVYNCSLSKLDSQKRRSMREVEIDALDMQLPERTTLNPADELEAEDFREIVDSALTELPEKYRAALTLYLVDDLSYEEISDVLKMPIGTVKTRLFRAKNQLRERVLAIYRHERYPSNAEDTQ
ncbi:MAG: RNA polymerase sigma factor RpoE [Ectothiorhodospiraceae bacterium]|nr:RNA polymerase sigma factor RpoE [Ectothiorhodospiraceae bacterium]